MAGQQEEAMTTTAAHDQGLRIGEVAKRVGVNPKTIRY